MRAGPGPISRSRRQMPLSDSTPAFVPPLNARAEAARIRHRRERRLARARCLAGAGGWSVNPRVSGIVSAVNPSPGRCSDFRDLPLRGACVRQPEHGRCHRLSAIPAALFTRTQSREQSQARLSPVRSPPRTRTAPLPPGVPRRPRRTVRDTASDRTGPEGPAARNPPPSAGGKPTPPSDPPERSVT